MTVYGTIWQELKHWWKVTNCQHRSTKSTTQQLGPALVTRTICLDCGQPCRPAGGISVSDMHERQMRMMSARGKL